MPQARPGTNGSFEGAGNPERMRNLPLPRNRLVWVVAGVALIIVLGLVSTQAFSAAMTITSQPLQNAGDGDLTYSSDYTAASAKITRHESTDLTMNVSDQVESVTVQGTKTSGGVDVKVDLLDASLTIVDTVTIALSTSAGTYSPTTTNLSSGNVAYSSVVKVLSTYTSTGGVPTNLTLALTDGYDSKNSTFLVADETFVQINSSNNDWWLLDTSGGTPAYFVSLQFDQTVPIGATINSVKVYIEHWEDNGFKAGELAWEVGTGTLSSPTVLGSTTPTVLNGSNNEAVVEWIVTAWIDTVAEANDMKVKIINNSTNGKKVNIDHVYAVVNYTPP